MKLAIIGAGAAGRLLAAQAIEAGHDVVLEDVLPSKLRSALAKIPTTGKPGKLTFADTVADAVREADLVVDFVPDELESKLEIVSMVDRMAPPHTILCIPTTALSVSDLASCTYRAERCIGVQMERSDLKLISGGLTSETTVQVCSGFWRSIGYAPQVLVDITETVH